MPEFTSTNQSLDQSVASIEYTNGQIERNSAEGQQVLPEVENKYSDAPGDLIGEPFNYDYILETYLGQFGKFQLRSFLWLCLPALLPGFITMSYSFTGAVPKYR